MEVNAYSANSGYSYFDIESELGLDMNDVSNPKFGLEQLHEECNKVNADIYLTHVRSSIENGPENNLLYLIQGENGRGGDLVLGVWVDEPCTVIVKIGSYEIIHENRESGFFKFPEPIPLCFLQYSTFEMTGSFEKVLFGMIYPRSGKRTAFMEHAKNQIRTLPFYDDYYIANDMIHKASTN